MELIPQTVDGKVVMACIRTVPHLRFPHATQAVVIVDNPEDATHPEMRYCVWDIALIDGAWSVFNRLDGTSHGKAVEEFNHRAYHRVRVWHRH
jgi:hypothetical protein